MRLMSLGMFKFLHDSNNLLANIRTPVSNLDNFVKKLNVNLEDKILPQKRLANIKDPSFKTKGLKNKVKK